MSRKTETTLLPELEEQLVAAARKLDGAARARRRRWLHGWPLVAALVAGLGTSVAVARVAEVGPFAYMNLDRMAQENPRLATTSVISVQAPGDAPAWMAQVSRNRLGQICMTGGPRDPRTNPDAKPSPSSPGNAPQNGVMCADNEEIAEALIDPERPGTTWAMARPLDGDLQGSRCRMNFKKRRCIPIETDPPTRMLVYGITSADGPAPVVRWGASGVPQAMAPSAERLRMPVDRSPEGLSPAEQRQVARYPAEIDLVLWAADVKIPQGKRRPQVVFADQFVPHGVTDGTIELLGGDELTELIERGEREGWKYRRHISRDAPPVRGTNAAQRRWIAAFTRRRAAGDAVPRRLRTERTRFSRLQFRASRKLKVVGGGTGDVWIAPGAMPRDTDVADGGDLFCMLGARIFTQCKFGQARWKRPFAEAVACAKGPAGGQVTFVWALTPPGAVRVSVRQRGGGVTTLRAGELLALRRPPDKRPESIVWFDASGRPTRVQVPWPTRTPTRCDVKRPGGTITRKDNAGSYEQTAGP